MTIDRARQIVNEVAEARYPLSPWTVLQALCVIERACGMRPVSEDQFQGHLQKVIDKVGAGK